VLIARRSMSEAACDGPVPRSRTRSAPSAIGGLPVISSLRLVPMMDTPWEVGPSPLFYCHEENVVLMKIAE
jgi:hypothetical protein